MGKMWQKTLKLLKILTCQLGSTWLQFFDRSLKGYTASNCALLTALSIKDHTSFNLVFSKALCWIGKKSFTLKLRMSINRHSRFPPHTLRTLKNCKLQKKLWRELGKESIPFCITCWGGRIRAIGTPSWVYSIDIRDIICKRIKTAFTISSALQWDIHIF